MNKILILTCGVLMMSSVALGDNTTAETCANGAGTVITGVVTGHKYCLIKQSMNWWNAYALCDGMERRLFSLDDCLYSSTGTGRCADLEGASGVVHIWTATPSGVEKAQCVNLLNGGIFTQNRGGVSTPTYTLCY